MKRAVLLFVGGLLLLCVLSLSLRTNHAGPRVAAAPQPTTLSQYPTTQGVPDINAIFGQINEERLSKGIQPLVRDATLTAVAQQRAQDMAFRHYYAHQSPDGRYFYDLIKQANYQIRYGCENLDLQFTQESALYVNDWLTSKSGHRECLLNAQTTRAGYAVTSFTVPNQTTIDTPMYIVVAIHAEPSY